MSIRKFFTQILSKRRYKPDRPEFLRYILRITQDMVFANLPAIALATAGSKNVSKDRGFISSLDPFDTFSRFFTKNSKTLRAIGTGLCLLSILAPFSLLAPQQPNTVIVLAPYADPRSPGRTINGLFERGIALQCAESLRVALTARLDNAHIVIAPPQHDPLSTAAFANGMQPNFFCSLSFYQERGPAPRLHLYRYTRDNALPLKKEELAFYPYDELYRAYLTESVLALTRLHENLATQRGIMCEPVCALPLKNLLGVAAPAFALEIGIPRDYEWSLLVEPLATGIAHAMAQV